MRIRLPSMPPFRDGGRCGYRGRRRRRGGGRHGEGRIATVIRRRRAHHRIPSRRLPAPLRRRGRRRRRRRRRGRLSLPPPDDDIVRGGGVVAARLPQERVETRVERVVVEQDARRVDVDPARAVRSGRRRRPRRRTTPTARGIRGGGAASGEEGHHVAIADARGLGRGEWSILPHALCVSFVVMVSSLLFVCVFCSGRIFPAG